ncbi:hypothetical protein [Elizabethkingia anophelis]|uniref:Uncharacterized protein n=1 Tax=Elizabethkingia anophelis TaxID=1117645 RepID=A0AAE4T6E6_9FLAO|nr:hypothetical protein [Elizabethkingia anophelis]MCT4127908.1 hypothetical protein [Elizabethkingia anophelis]MDV3665439.1 hypothetical protein [Elizabethkingia anophelis]MDV3844973.1 hypothetical protein [Elizabethkingia anophelis]MDV3945161.1 hypothetical protein [Elizabethkingia anophelis]MDV3948673.1 hypothetical protein [Elizabethkingia anophelis]
MNKETKKRPSYNTEILNALAAEFMVTTRFVRMCINKDSKSLTADTIRKKYYELATPSIKALENFKTNGYESTKDNNTENN